MKIKKMLLAGVAVLAMAAFAVPASASAAQWTENGQALSHEATVGLEGTIGYRSDSVEGSLECGVHAQATLTPSGGGQFDSFDLDLESCQGTGALANCQPVGSEVATGPISLASYKIAFDYAWGFVLQEGCWLSGDVWQGEVLANPNNSAAISGVALEGSVGSVSGFGSFDVYGELAVTPAETYGIEG